MLGKTNMGLIFKHYSCIWLFPVPKEAVAYFFFLEHPVIFVGRVEGCGVLYFSFLVLNLSFCFLLV